MAISVLIIDDEDISREITRRYMEKTADLRIIGEADNGLTGLTLVEKCKPDVTVTDIEMPVMGGLEITRRILEQFPEARIILYSSHNERLILDKAVEAGAWGYVVKDANGSRLIDAIHSVAKGKFYFNLDFE